MDPLQRLLEKKAYDGFDSQRHSLDDAAYTALVSSAILGAIYALWICTWLIFDITWEGSESVAVIFQILSFLAVFLTGALVDRVFRRRRGDDFPKKQPSSVLFLSLVVGGASGFIGSFATLNTDAFSINRTDGTLGLLFLGVVMVVGFIAIWAEFFLRRRSAERDFLEGQKHSTEV